MYLRIILLGFCLCFPAIASSEDSYTDAEKLEEMSAVLAAMEKENSVLRKQLQKKIDPRLIAAYNKSWEHYYDHQQALRSHAVSALKWQLRTAYCLTILVLVVTGLGIYLSIVEVRAVLMKPREMEQKVLAQDTQSTAQERIELTLSLQKLQVTSAVTGVVILVLSLAFLYLFVKEVFEIDPQNFSAQAIPTTLPEEDQADDSASRETASP